MAKEVFKRARLEIKQNDLKFVQCGQAEMYEDD